MGGGAHAADEHVVVVDVASGAAGLDADALRAAIAKFIDNMVRRMETIEWSGKVAAVDGDEVTVNAGRKVAGRFQLDSRGLPYAGLSLLLHVGLLAATLLKLAPGQTGAPTRTTPTASGPTATTAPIVEEATHHPPSGAWATRS